MCIDLSDICSKPLTDCEPHTQVSLFIHLVHMVPSHPGLYGKGLFIEVMQGTFLVGPTTGASYNN